MSRVREASPTPVAPSPCKVEPITAKGHQTAPTDDGTTRFVSPLTRVQRPLKRFKVWASAHQEVAFSQNLPNQHPAKYLIAKDEQDAQAFYVRELKVNDKFYSVRAKLLED